MKINTEQTLIVYKVESKSEDSDKGWCKPLFSLNNEDIENIDQNEYPLDIFISKSYTEIDSNYAHGELFLLEKHMLDEERTQERGCNQFFSLGHFSKSLKPNMLIPIMEGHLPNREDGLLNPGILPPSADIFFIRDIENNKLFGPVTSTKEENGQYKILPKTTQAIRGLANDDLAIYDFDKIKHLILSATVNKRENLYLPLLKALSSLPFEKLDFISDDRLITYFGNLEVGKNCKLLAKREAQKLQDGLKKQRKLDLMPSDRLSRLEKIIEQYLSEESFGTTLIDDFLKSDDGSLFLNKYVEDNKTNLLDNQIEIIKSQANDKKRELKQDLDKLESLITDKKNELQHIHDEIKEDKQKLQEKFMAYKAKLDAELAEAKSQSEEEKQVILAEQQHHKKEQIKSLNTDITNLNSIIDEKETKLVDIENTLSKYFDIHDLHTEKKILERSLKSLKADCDEQIAILDSSIATHTEILKDNTLLSASMTKVKLVNDILNGRKFSQEQQIINISPPELEPDQPNTAIDLVERISASLDNDGGKTFTNDELLNILISFTQSFLTILSGPPGIGKTSTVIRLANAMNMGDIDGKQNFIYIPVGRGWVSSRDILGFYNSLRESYQPARTGLFEFLKRNEEPEYNISPRLILLDEANLSSIEHYWSDFIGLCDNEGRSKAIDTGHQDRSKGLLEVGKNVRFIATINNDSTTERLSPRLINRAPVITLGHSIDSNNMMQLTKLQGALDYSNLESLFLPNNREIAISDKQILDDVISILEMVDPSMGQSVTISPRKILAIHNYCAVASRLMENEEALDFAIAQHILPNIEHFGSAFKIRLEKLRDRLGNQFPRSKGILERIIVSGSDFTNSYSFF